MQFGLFMMPLHPPERSFTESYDRDLAQIVLADRLGYHEVWIGEHLTERWENAPAPELLIAQALLKTERIILATGVTLLVLHNPVELAHRIAHEPDLVVLDVREPVEWADGHIRGARHVPMREVADRLAEIPRDRRVALTCAGGVRSSLVGSLLLARGFTDLLNVWGGMTGWTQAGLPVTRN